MTDLITIRRDDLHAVMARAGAEEWDPTTDPDFAEVWQRLTEAKDADLEAQPEPGLPEGIYGRIELPGYRENLGWVSEATRFGMQVAVVRNRAGEVTAEVTLGPACRFVHLPVPALLADQPPPERAALPAGVAAGADECTCEIGENTYCDVHPF